MITNFKQICGNFSIPGKFIRAIPWGNGHIHDTYAATWNLEGTETRYILQRINSKVFKHPGNLMDNIITVTNHIRRNKDQDPADNRPALELIRAKDGQPFVVDIKKNIWRAFNFIEDTVSCELTRNPDLIFEAAAAFGRFQKELADLNCKDIHETLPHFHHTVKRFENLEHSILADKFSRAVHCAPEIRFIRKHEKRLSKIVDHLEKRTLPLRITHNDTKLNNVLLDTKTHKGVCVIDLDTVMPGSVLYDFGDLVRTAANNASEDEKNLNTVFIRLDMFEAVTKGYLSEANVFLTDLERSLLVTGAQLMTLENGIRFLTDFLDGDKYFKTSRPLQNLERARAQFRLFYSMQANHEEMETIVCQYAGQDLSRVSLGPQIL